MNSVFMENMPGIRNKISNSKAIKSSTLDSLRPYKLKGSFTEAAAYALNEANMSWNQTMIMEAANELKAIKEGFTDTAKEKIRKVKDTIIEWAKRLWKMFTAVFTKAIAYAKTIFASGKKLFKKNLEQIRLGQKYYSEGKYSTKTKLYHLVNKSKLDGFYSSVNDILTKLSNATPADVANIKEQFSKRSKQGSDSGNEVPYYVITDIYEAAVDAAYNEVTELNNTSASDFSLSYIESIINFKNDADKSYKQIKKDIDNSIKSLNGIYNDLDSEDKANDQGKNVQDLMFMIKAFMRGVNAAHIGILSVFKKAGATGTKVIRLYARAGMMGPDGQKKKK